MADLGALTPVAVFAVLYLLGLSRMRARTTCIGDDTDAIAPIRAAAGLAAIVVLAAALGPPLDGWASTDLAAHMIQHVALLALAPPLLVFGDAPRVLVAAASDRNGARIARVVERIAPPLRRVPLPALIAISVSLQTATLGIWHLPAVYDAAVTHAALHAVEHGSFLLAGFFFWWTVAGAGRRDGSVASVIGIFVASLPATLLGALMTLSTAPWYPHYATGAVSGALRDQQLAGVVMWAGGGMVYVAAGTALFVAWLRGLERNSPARVALESVS